jgi:2-phosphoglycolate phosphatase
LSRQLEQQILYQAVLFDLDGTLLDTEPDFTLLINRMLQARNLGPVESGVIRRVVSAGARAMVRAGFSKTDDDPVLEALVDEFLVQYLQLIPDTTASLFEDMDMLIASLNEAGIPWGIMTNKARRFTEPLLACFETFSTCSTLVCRDDVPAGKPDPAGILRGCAALGIAPDSCAYVGDHPRDMEAAVKAGTPAIAVRWGYLPVEEIIEQWGAAFIAETPAALATHLLGRQPS